MQGQISRRQFVQILGAGAAVSLLAACGSSDDESTATGAAQTGGGSASTAAAPAATSASGSPAVAATGAATQAAGTATRDKLTIGLSTETGSLDSSTLVTTEAQIMFSNIYDALIYRNSKGELVPRLAEKWEQVDDTTLRFSLRSGVKFHNGEDFNADSVKLTMERYADEKSQARTKTATIQEVKIVDSSTVDFITKTPDPLLLGTMSIFFMLPPKYYQEKGTEGVSAHPIGTGPFVFKEWTKADHVTLTANDDYWGAKPKVKTVVFRFIPEDATRVAGIQNGDLDLANDIPPALAKELSGNDEITLSTANDPAIVHVGLKYKDEILKNQKVRQALQYATNKEAIVERLLFGYATVAGQVAMPDAFGHNPDVKPYPYDIDKAKQLLTEAGYPDGFDIPMDAPIGYVAHAQEVAQAVIGDWAKVGVKVTLTMTEWATYNSEKLLSKDRAGLAPTYVMLKRYPSLDVGETLNTAFPSDAQWNYDQYSNPQIDEMIKEQGSTLDQDKRKETIFQIEQILHDDAPYVWLYWAQWIHGARKGINYKVRPDGLIIVNDDVSFS
jgi:peptide/nickel transport system substrate-binding protein